MRVLFSKNEIKKKEKRNKGGANFDNGKIKNCTLTK